jgi:para-nitrobenzyl esterase
MKKKLMTAVLLGTIVLAAISCAGGPATGVLQEPGRWTGSSVVTTRYGMVEAREADDQTWVWKAIPFARPPIGELRWRAPQEPLPWVGVRSPGMFNGGCTQFSPVVAGSIHGSEDCLYLNVWRPQGAETGLPVYVWIHGGGNSMGSAMMVRDYSGHRVASRSRMVFVSMNYRLGPFGWFTHPALRDGVSAEDASGNYGTLDIIQALKWIQENIEAFGGDPHDVTVTGESAGGFNVLSLLISPPARGLFQRAMSQSGAAITHGIDEADAASQTVLEKLLMADGKARTMAAAQAQAASMPGARVRAFLRSRTDRDILRCYNRWSRAMIDNPAILRDGTVIPAEGFGVLSTGEYASKVPLIIGSNKEELKLFLFLSGAIPWRSALYAAAARSGSDRWKAAGVDEVARLLTSHSDQPPVYAYQFCWGAPDAQGKGTLPGTWGTRLGAFHSLEIPFFLGTDTLEGVLQTVFFTARNEPGRKALSDAMMDYVAAFARTGDPNRPGSGLPAWSPWNNDQGAEKCMIFDARDDSRSLAMSPTELTDQGVMDSAGLLPEPLRSETLRYLSLSRMPAVVR